MSQELLSGNSNAEHRTEPNHHPQAEEVTTSVPTPNRFWRMMIDRVLTAGSQPRAIRRHSRGLSRSHQPSSSADKHGANHRTLPTAAYIVGNPSIGSYDDTPLDGVACGPELGRSTRGRGAQCRTMEIHADSLATVPTRSWSHSHDPAQASHDLDTLSSDPADSLRE
ncbi:hypothetical protein B296_00013873 [Ensete ventricosum]|uniref:Uncharacterized protein n=1 Tax=Ensete ventricosum TaxID=4639 RepID=A0A426ZNK0_ENSVE|nr:hypothetical protein B296_00013873 [Ensete ventricosum]